MEMAGKISYEAANGNEEETQAQVDIWKFVFGFTEMAVVKCAVELGIPDILEQCSNPMTLSELSSALSCSSPALFRVMRFLMNCGIFKEKITSQGSVGYVQTPLSRLLTRNGKNSLASMLLFLGSPPMIGCWHYLSARVMANETPAFFASHGEDLWQYAAKNPGFSNTFNEAMASDTRTVLPLIVESCPEVFNDLSSVVDVGGGDGTAIRCLVKACPRIRGINFDLPHVVSVAPECEGTEHVGGDMFKSVPKANAVFLKWILHDWADEECIQILKNCREAISGFSTGKVIIVEAIIEENNKDKLKDVGLMLDMLMMTYTTKGKERSEGEWAYILREAGFTRHTVKNIQVVQSIIEAYP